MAKRRINYVILNVLVLILVLSFAYVFGLFKKDDTSKSLDMTTLSLPKRLAFMSGHVQAGLELYRLNMPKMAAPHLLHPISEIYDAEREGLDKIGFNAEIFKKVSQSLEQNLSDVQVENLLMQANENLEFLTKEAKGQPEEIIIFLLKTANKEYMVAIEDNEIIEVGEYQDAWGFIKVALQQTTRIDDKKKSKALKIKLLELHKNWSKGPIPVDNPVGVETIANQVDEAIRILKN